MLRIGYVHASEKEAAAAVLRDLGCDVVRAESQAPVAGQAVLASILEFIGEGDQLVVTSLCHVGRTAGSLLQLVHRLDCRGASLRAADPAVTSAGVEGQTFRAVLQALAAIEDSETERRRSRASQGEILALRSEGLGPAEIARRLGVSRMTVYRRLRAASC
jgi:DNA invertase Pin-like site-specific DNA recombinase